MVVVGQVAEVDRRAGGCRDQRPQDGVLAAMQRGESPHNLSTYPARDWARAVVNTRSPVAARSVTSASAATSASIARWSSR